MHLHVVERGGQGKGWREWLGPHGVGRAWDGRAVEDSHVVQILRQGKRQGRAVGCADRRRAPPRKAPSPPSTAVCQKSHMGGVAQGREMTHTVSPTSSCSRLNLVLPPPTGLTAAILLRTQANPPRFAKRITDEIYHSIRMTKQKGREEGSENLHIVKRRSF